jgi:hypothetical protein
MHQLWADARPWLNSWKMAVHPSMTRGAGQTCQGATAANYQQYWTRRVGESVHVSSHKLPTRPPFGDEFIVSATPSLGGQPCSRCTCKWSGTNKLQIVRDIWNIHRGTGYSELCLVMCLSNGKYSRWGWNRFGLIRWGGMFGMSAKRGFSESWFTCSQSNIIEIKLHSNI